MRSKYIYKNYKIINTTFNSHPDIDHEVRWCIFKLADLLIRPVEEAPPSVKIHIPSTPVIEAPPPLPAVKVPPKAPRVLKTTGGPPIKSPLVSLNPPTKLKLPASPHPDAIPAKLPPIIPEVRKKEVAFAKPQLPSKVSNSHSKSKTKQTSKITERPAHVPKAQSGGMSLNDLKASRSALKKLKTNKRALIFLQPVDPIRDHAPK